MVRDLKIYERVCQEADYIIVNKATVRQTAEEFGLSKSTIHRDLSELLPEWNASLSSKVSDVFQENKSLRHIRGGEATRLKYLKK